jgi:ATP-binding cassette subfamily B protein
MIKDIKKTIQPLNPVRLYRISTFFLPYLRKYRWKMILGVVLAVMVVAFMVAQPWPFKILFDSVLMPIAETPSSFPWINELADDPRRLIALLAGAIVLLAVGRSVCQFYQTMITRRVGQRMIVTLRRDLFEHIQSLSLRFHNESRSGDLLMRLTTDINRLRDLFVEILITALSNVLIVAVIVSVMVWINWKLTLLVLCGILPTVVAVNFFSGIQIRKAAHRQRQKESEISVTAYEALLGVQTIQAYNQEQSSQAVFEKHAKGGFKEEMRVARLEATAAQYTEILLAIGVACIVGYGSLQVLHDPPLQTPGSLLLYYFYLRMLQRPLRSGARLFVLAGKAAASAERVMDIFMTEPEIQDAPDARPAPPFRGEIEFRNATFRYASGAEAIRNLNLKIMPGEKVALIGESGSGKTTLCSLICRFYDPQEGQVLIDGVDIRTVKVDSLRRQISLMLQDPMLFATTVYDNIAFAEENTTYEQIERAARRARADEFISRLPDGYDTFVAERGVSLSQGQKQRLALARSFLKEAPILILDEPTSNVDAASERLIIKSVRKLMEGTTCILITHNMRLVADMDRIIILEAGEIVEEGSPQQLIELGGRYAQLVSGKVKAAEPAANWEPSHEQPQTP